MKQTNKKILNLQELKFLSFSNLKIGLFGGSFDPAHEGHLNISLEALKYYHFDYIIWIIANQNPHKAKATQDIFTRARDASEFTKNNSKILISTIENDLNCYYSYHVIKYFVQNFSSCKFTWLMGIDAFLGFGAWHKKNQIRQLCDIIVFDRPIFNRLVNIYSLNGACALDKTKTHPIILHRGKLNNISSSFIRYKNEFK
jgi:nicotinate (nicotinamide) nucleotide adenylyltransferase